jgi:hypothetical protein
MYTKKKHVELVSCSLKPEKAMPWSLQKPKKAKLVELGKWERIARQDFLHLLASIYYSCVFFWICRYWLSLHM